MTTPVRYGEQSRAELGSACMLCGARERQPYADHCHHHGWVRGDLCPRCNTLMALIDRRIAPLESSLTAPLTLAALVEHAGRCPDCEPFSVENLGPTRSLKPARKAVRESLNLRGPGDLKRRVEAYAKRTGISVNAAACMLLAAGLRAERRRGE